MVRVVVAAVVCGMVGGCAAMNGGAPTPEAQAFWGNVTAGLLAADQSLVRPVPQYQPVYQPPPQSLHCTTRPGGPFEPGTTYTNCY